MQERRLLQDRRWVRQGALYGCQDIEAVALVVDRELEKKSDEARAEL